MTGLNLAGRGTSSQGRAGLAANGISVAATIAVAVA
jgi:hypothetical protein